MYIIFLIFLNTFIYASSCGFTVPKSIQEMVQDNIHYQIQNTEQIKVKKPKIV